MQFLLRIVVIVTIVLIGAFKASAQPRPAAPPTPKKYNVDLRYRIIAPRDEHVARYDKLIDHLTSLGFEFDPSIKRPNTDREDPGKDRLHGSIPSQNILKILENPDVAGLLLTPENLKLPDEPENRVRVQLELVSGYGPRQRTLARQTHAMLTQFGFNEAVQYDHRGYADKPYSRLVGELPRKYVDNLLKDLRTQPAGWLSTVIDPSQLPAPIRHQSPIRFVEVLPAKKPLVGLQIETPRSDKAFEKITPELWKIVKNPTTDAVRIQVILRDEEALENWRGTLLQAAPSFFIEGHLGLYITGILPPSQIKSLAALESVSVLRVPRTPFAAVDSSIVVNGKMDPILEQTGLKALHLRKSLGQGVRIAVLDRDFRGYQAMIEKKFLPESTRLVDLTTLRNPDIEPIAEKGDLSKVGHGTQCAMAVALAAPKADIVLIRLDVIAPFEFQQIARFLEGDIVSPYLKLRQGELNTRRAELRRRRFQLNKEGAVILNDFKDELPNETDFGFLGPVRGWLFSKRLWHYQRILYHEKQVAKLEAKQIRFDGIASQMVRLQGINIVVSPLLWNDGYPLGGGSAVSRWFANDPKSKLLWIQSAGNSRGQTWLGPFRDADNNGVMEFVPNVESIAAKRWTGELNFLAWQPFAGKQQFELPATATFRASVQWQEPHDPVYFTGNPDMYRFPLVPLRIVLLRQVDPNGQEIRADTFEVVAQSTGFPQRLQHRPNFSLYEQTLDVTLPTTPGRYALRIERPADEIWVFELDDDNKPVLEKLIGFEAKGIRPQGAPVLSQFQKEWELKPRVFVNVTDETFRRQGRPVFLDYFTHNGSIGVPATGRTIISVGAATLSNRAQLYSGIGPPAFVPLFPSPTTWMYDAVAVGPSGTGGAFGSSLAASLTAGAAASMLSDGVSTDALRRSLQERRGMIFRVPNKK